MFGPSKDTWVFFFCMLLARANKIGFKFSRWSKFPFCGEFVLLCILVWVLPVLFFFFTFVYGHNCFVLIHACLVLFMHVCFLLFFPVGWCCFLYVFRQVKQNRVIAKLSLREYYFPIEVTLNGYTCNVFWLWGLKFWSIFMHCFLFAVFLIHVFSDVIHHDINFLCLIDTIYCCSFLVILLVVEKNRIRSVPLFFLS